MPSTLMKCPQRWKMPKASSSFQVTAWLLRRHSNLSMNSPAASGRRAKLCAYPRHSRQNTYALVLQLKGRCRCQCNTRFAIFRFLRCSNLHLAFLSISVHPHWWSVCLAQRTAVSRRNKLRASDLFATNSVVLMVYLTPKYKLSASNSFIWKKLLRGIPELHRKYPLLRLFSKSACWIEFGFYPFPVFCYLDSVRSRYGAALVKNQGPRRAFVVDVLAVSDCLFSVSKT